MSIAKRKRKAKNARRRRRRLEVMRRQIFGADTTPMPDHPDVIGVAYRALRSLAGGEMRQLRKLVGGAD